MPLIIELHGNAFKVRCLKCGAEYNRDEIQARLNKGEEVPHCNKRTSHKMGRQGFYALPLKCGGLLKPTTVLFGQAMPEKETNEAFERARQCDLLIVLGSSLVVYPAARVPVEAVNAGAKLAIINLTTTPHDDYANIVIHGKCGEVMKKVIMKLDTAK